MSRYCMNCGAKLRDRAQFCNACGMRAEPRQAPRCAYCGGELREGSQFCPTCGRSVNAAPTPQAPIAPATVRPAYAAANIAAPQKKRIKPLAIILPAIAVVLAAAILVTGLVAPGWMKGSGGVKITPIYSDNSYIELSMPDYNKETNCVNTVSSMAIQAQLCAMLTEEKFYRAVDDGVHIEELRALSQDNQEAWEAADVLSSASYMMGMSLRKAEKNAGYKSTATVALPRIVMDNPFVLSASALEMDYFDNAKEWAEYITRVYDHAKAGSKAAYVAKILKTDVKRAQKSIEMAQAILWGEGEAQAHNDSATLTALQATKTAGKVAGFVGATIASGGVAASLSGGALATGGYIASGADTLMELGDSTLQFTLGEDHQVTKTYQEAAAKVAPIVSIVSFANIAYNPEAWDKGIDVAGNYRYIADSAVDLINGKIFCIDCPMPEDSGIFKVLTMPVGDKATPEDIEKAAQALSDMGFDKEAVKQALTAPPEDDEDEGPEPAERAFSEITDEELDQKIDYTSLTEEEWDKLFQEVYDEFIDEMKEKGLISEDDDIWSYDPFMPIEDFPEDGDELGFDDIANWAKPDMPYEESGDNPDDEGEPAQPGDEEGFDNPESRAKPENPSTLFPSASQLAGTYQGTKTEWTVIGGEFANEHVYDDRKIEFNYKDGQLYYGSGKTIPLTYDPATGKAYGELSDTTYEFEFKVMNGNIHVKETRLYYYNSSSPTGKTVFEGDKFEQEIDAQYWVGTYDTVQTQGYNEAMDGTDKVWVYVKWDEDAERLKVTIPRTSLLVEYDPKTQNASGNLWDNPDEPVIIVFSEKNGVRHMLFQWNSGGENHTYVYEGDWLG